MIQGSDRDSSLKCRMCESGNIVSNLDFTMLYCLSCDYDFATVIDGRHGIKVLWGSRRKKVDDLPGQ